MINSGNLPAARLKASLTRRSGTKGMKVKASVRMAPVMHDGDATPDDDLSKPVANSAPTVTAGPKKKPYNGRFKFLGSMKKGGVISRTGLWLMHKGERVHNPFLRGKG